MSILVAQDLKHAWPTIERLALAVLRDREVYEAQILHLYHAEGPLFWTLKQWIAEQHRQGLEIE
jgi:hypothetical protein